MVIFNKIVLCIVVLSLPLFSFSQQSDTSLKIPNNIIEINYSPKGLFSGNSLYLIKSTNSNSTNEIYKITPQYAIDASYNKLLTKNLKKVHQFYIGLTINYTAYNVNHQFYNYQLTGGGLGAWNTIEYSQKEINYNAQCLNIGPQLSYLILFKHLVIKSKVAVLLRNNFSAKANYYTVNEYREGYDKSTTYATPSNPDGWYLNKQLLKSTDEKESGNETSIGLYLSTGIGIRIKRFILSEEVAVTSISKLFNHPLLKFQTGISYLF